MTRFQKIWWRHSPGRSMLEDWTQDAYYVGLNWWWICLLCCYVMLFFKDPATRFFFFTFILRQVARAIAKSSCRGTFKKPVTDKFCLGNSIEVFESLQRRVNMTAALYYSGQVSIPIIWRVCSHSAFSFVKWQSNESNRLLFWNDHEILWHL